MSSDDVATGPDGEADDPASAYTCDAPSNPDRGFANPFHVDVAGSDPRVMTLAVADLQPRELGIVSETTLTSDDQPAFDTILGIVGVGNPDVTGIADPSVPVTRVTMYAVEDTEVALFRLFSDDVQIGGAFFADGHGTRCLPMQSQRPRHAGCIMQRACR